MEQETINIMIKKVITTEKAPTAIGPYSQAILVGNTLYCSGQIAIVPETGNLITHSINEETHQVMKNISNVLKAANMDFSNVVKSSIFIRNMNQYAEINQVYDSYFNNNPPAREAVEVSALPMDTNIEISVIAVK